MNLKKNLTRNFNSKPPHHLSTAIKPIIFDIIRKLKPSWPGELQITETIQLLLENGYNAGYQIVKG